MQIGFVGLGAVVETAYLPALKRLSSQPEICWGFDVNPDRRLPGVQCCESLASLLAKPLDMLFITTTSLQHLPILEAALTFTVANIVIEKPVVATLAQISRLRVLLNDPDSARRVLALDHWMARAGALKLALGELDSSWQAENGNPPGQPLITSLQDIVRIDGFLQEPSGFNEKGEPVALNFATGEIDTRQLHHPDGVIVDIGTHVLAMLRETLHHCGGDNFLHLEVQSAKDRLGVPITQGDLQTAEGEAHLFGELCGIPVNIYLNKYAGSAGGQKGIRLWLRDGKIISQDRERSGEVVELIDGRQTLRWRKPGAVYAHCLQDCILGANSVFTQAPNNVAQLTQRRIEEVEALLQLQQQLRGPH
ncbi:oxidoreductase [Citrobacter sp. NCU1]|uniref:Gfo/Idh/MocA family oxidoreductase n=1 Tax=Citrobacter sp. NCU1 TaxID=2026683 RepID=UPI0013919D39|nr:Gfo/Idh/MocA family oxidoreductase [Citrobacter sp. NCU1]NDO79447.1 oxidoreductase [Citrobacter sp. NCU1]